MNASLKKYGRRVAGSYGRPGSKKLKRAASKAARKGSPRRLADFYTAKEWPV